MGKKVLLVCSLTPLPSVSLHSSSNDLETGGGPGPGLFLRSKGLGDPRLKTCGSELLGDGCTLHAPGLILMQGFRGTQQLQFPKLSSSAGRGNAQQIDCAGGPLSHKWSHSL